MDNRTLVLGVSDFVAYANQTLEFAYPGLVIEGELANFRVSKNRWVYFDLKDDEATLRFFATVYQLNGPLEDGMKLRVRGVPKIHPQYGFSVTVQSIELAGEGTIKRAAALLEAKLSAEGLFAPERKRLLPYPPETIGLITSGESAAYADFVKIVAARWPSLRIEHADVQVQGADAPAQIVRAINYFSEAPTTPDTLVLIRGGGSPEDLQAFNEESVVRAIASSRVPTMVAIGHENDVCLAELAADRRASTPSNAAELLVPDKTTLKAQLQQYREHVQFQLSTLVKRQTTQVEYQEEQLSYAIERTMQRVRYDVMTKRQLLAAYSPDEALKRGYALVRYENKLLKHGGKMAVGDTIAVEMSDVTLTAQITDKKEK